MPKDIVQVGPLQRGRITTISGLFAAAFDVGRRSRLRSVRPAQRIVHRIMRLFFLLPLHHLLVFVRPWHATIAPGARGAIERLPSAPRNKDAGEQQYWQR
jgi:hypothetical protein